MENQEAEKLHTIGFPKCRNRFYRKINCFQTLCSHFLYFDKQAFIYFWIIRKKKWEFFWASN